ncbi:MAG: hypothetical protein R8K20_10805, partial [Gallionellaceae bacterium]
SLDKFSNIIYRRQLCSSYTGKKPKDYFPLRAPVINALAKDYNLNKDLDPDRFSIDDFISFGKEKTHWQAKEYMND